MIYSTYYSSQQMAHWVIDNTFPSTPAIATTSAFMGWYGYQAGMCYSQGIMIEALRNYFGYLPGSFLAPFLVPSAAPEISIYARIGASCATSLTLNLISKRIFGIPPAANKLPAKKEPPPAKKEEPKEEPVEEAPKDLTEDGPLPPPHPEVLKAREPRENSSKKTLVPGKKPVKPKIRTECCWGQCQRPPIKPRKKALLPMS